MEFTLPKMGKAAQFVVVVVVVFLWRNHFQGVSIFKKKYHILDLSADYQIVTT